MCPSHPAISILNKPEMQTTIVKLGVLPEDCMGCMTAGTKYVPQPLGKLMHIVEERTLPHQKVRRSANNFVKHTKNNTRDDNIVTCMRIDILKK